MKNYLLLSLSLFLFPIAIFAHGESPAMFTIIGYVFIVPFIVGLIEYYLIKRKINVKRNGKLKSTFLSFGITFLGYLISFLIIDSLKIVNEKLVITLIMTLLTIMQLIAKVLIYKLVLINNKDDFGQMKKIVIIETVLINLFFYLIIMIMI